MGVAVALAAGAAIGLPGCGSSGESGGAAYGVLVTAHGGLDAIHSASGEGLVPTADRMATGRARAEDGGPEVPIATVNGPGSRTFASRTITFPRSRRGFIVRQVLPNDLATDAARTSFVRWRSFAAVLPGAARGAITSRLAWRPVPRQGLRVDGGRTVRLRTVFSIPETRARCVGPAAQGVGGGRRTLLRVSGAPAWLVRTGPREPWQWLRAEGDRVGGVLRAIRTGPAAAVYFGSAWGCVEKQPTGNLIVDPDVLAPPSGTNLPPEPPDGY